MIVGLYFVDYICKLFVWIKYYVVKNVCYYYNKKKYLINLNYFI